jgi:uncharacterized protein (DUF2141 family)
MRKAIAFFCICFMLGFFLSADPATWTVSGTLAVGKPGTVFISLLDEKGFKDNYRYLKRLTLTVGPDEIKAGKVSFEFTEIPTGIYSLSAFLDVNGNGRLDSGVFGPLEPWANFRRARPLMRGPNWEEVAFPVDKNVTDAALKFE